MKPTKSKIFNTLAVICCFSVLAACSSMKTGDLDFKHRPQPTAAAVPERDYIWGMTNDNLPVESSVEQEERLAGDIEPEPEQTKAQEIQDLKLLGKWEEGVPAVEYADEEVTYDFPVTVNRQVQYYLDFFTGRHREHFAVWLSRSGRYLPMIQEYLRAAGLPEDLVYLAMIESGFNERAYSRARAVGVWQFIKGTGRNYGLQINTYVDERRDPIKSTEAAVAYLGDLYAEFGSWYLSVAAYNAGEGKIRRAIKKYNTTDFWEIAQGRYLKLETKRYVPKLIAAILIAKEPEKYGFDNLEYEAPLAYETVEVPRWTALKAVALACDMEPAELKKYNNELRKEFTPPDKASYPFKVPVGMKDKVEENLPRVQAVVSTGFKNHTVRSGETLDGICRKYGLTKTLVLKSNNLRSPGLKAGQRLRIPYQTTKYEMLPEGTVAKGYMEAEAGSGNFVLHKVLPGDTVYELSRRYGVPIHLIAAWNDLNDISRIRAGQQLVFYVQNSSDQVAAVSAGSSESKQFVPARNKTVVADDEPKSQRANSPLASTRNNPDGSAQSYVVQEGDSLWTISRKHNISPNEIKRWNDLHGNLIHPGDTLLLKVAQAEEPVGETSALSAVPSEEPVDETFYQVRSGDSLWTISRKHNISPNEIKRWNDLHDNLIHPGDTLLLKVAQAEEPVGETFYQVRSGDSLWTIARKHNISPEEIKRWNNLKDNTIYPGNRLLLKLASGG